MAAINKIFGIGLSKTGTTSLARALYQLGFATKDFPSVKYVPHRLLHIRAEQLHHYQAFTDITVIPFYKQLDKEFPNSKFIYTVRNRDNWLKSCAYYPRFLRPVYRLPLKVIKMRQLIYNTVRYDQEKFIAAYERHDADVLEYFKDRPDDLLTIDICGGDAWQPICEFLDVPIPIVPFPLANARKNNYI